MGSGACGDAIRRLSETPMFVASEKAGAVGGGASRGHDVFTTYRLEFVEDRIEYGEERRVTIGGRSIVSLQRYVEWRPTQG